MKVFLWAVFGNDEEFLWPELQPGYTGDWNNLSRRFWLWWLRNRAHNLSFHVLLRRVVNPVYVWPRTFRQPTDPRHETQYICVLRFRPFFLKLGYLFVGWRSDTPMVGAWGGKFDTMPGYGGKFDIGLKDMN